MPRKCGQQVMAKLSPARSPAAGSVRPPVAQGGLKPSHRGRGVAASTKVNPTKDATHVDRGARSASWEKRARSLGVPPRMTTSPLMSHAWAENSPDAPRAAPMRISVR